MSQIEDKKVVGKTEIQRMPIEEFRAKGYLQELNRVFLHPLGLAIEIKLNEDGTESLGGIWDYRDDPEGLYFALDKEPPDSERLSRFREHAKFVVEELNARNPVRVGKLGYVIEPIPEPKIEEN
jgi:hypothetical protein